jgi:hypothetical protein
VRRHAKAIVAISALLLLTGAVGANLAAATAPVVTIDPVTTASYTTAHVTGTVDPADRETYFYFQYAIDPDSEGWIDGPEKYATALNPAQGPTPVSESLTGLKPGTTYQLRLVAENFSEPATTISAEPNPTFTTEAVGPPSVAIDPVTTFTGTTAHFTGTIDPEATDVDPAFDVDWHFECTPGCPGLEGGTITADNAGTPDSGIHVIEADAAGLQPNTTYEVSLVAENDGGPASDGPVSFKTGQADPEAQTLFAGDIGTGSATLAANVNPKNAAVAYRFEWGTDQSYGNSTPVTPLGVEDNEFHVLTTPISGLSPGATYQFRVVVENTETSVRAEGPNHGFTTAAPAGPPSPASCPNEALRSGPSARLPDCRAYEMVSPLDKNGGDVEPNFTASEATNASGASPDGNALAYNSRTTFGSGAQGSSLFPTARSVRGPGGWSTTAIAPPGDNNSGGAAFTVLDFLSDDLLQSVFVTPAQLTAGAADLGGSFPSRGLYLRDESGATTYRLLSDPTFALPPEVSDTGAAVRFSMGAATPDMSRIVFNSNRQLLPDAPPTVAPTTGSNSVYLWRAGEALELISTGYPPDTVGEKVYAGSSSQPRSYDGGQHIVSDDGSRVYFTVGLVPTEGNIFVRHNPGTSAATTEPVGFGTFLSARASDGAVALFYSVPQGLLRWDATAPPGSRLTELTPSAGEKDLLGGAGVSESADTAYFVSLEAIGEGAIAGRPNLYVWRLGDGVRFIATLADKDQAVWEKNRTIRGGARVTPDGDRLLFTSSLRLTAHDNDGASQAYLYDYERDALVCVSCGAEPSASSSALFRADAMPRQLPRNLSTDGSRAFFETDQALLAGDVNGRGDVYMWSDPDRDLAGSPSLVSSGKDPSPSRFMNASHSGDDVFFATRQQLVRFDTDNHIDAYDARVGGGFPFQGGGSDCQAESCQGEPAPASVRPSPLTLGFQGSGNSRADQGKKRCVKGKAKRKGRCMKKKQRGSRHGRRTGQ